MTRPRTTPPRESADARRARTARLVAGLRRAHPDALCELDHRNAFELLVATILSAQCTDVRVNQVTPALFARYPTPRALAAADPAEVEALIRPTGFFRAKTERIIGAARRLEEAFGGEVPRTMDELLTVPGAARKTANVVLGVAYGIGVGVVVDTHVLRLSARLGLTRETTPEKVEEALMALVPQPEWIDLSHLLIFHGRRVCAARKPACERCVLAPDCPRVGVGAA